MKISAIVRQHWAALRALLALSAITGLGYPLLVWGIAQLPPLREKANGSVVAVAGKPLGSSLIGQLFTDSAGTPLPRYFQSRPSAAGDGYDPMASGASNLGPENIVDTPDQPSLLTQVCTRSAAVGHLNGVNGTRPYCTGDGVGAVLSVIGPRDARGAVPHPTQVISVNEPCAGTATPFLASYEGVPVQCAGPTDNPALGQLVAVRGTAPDHPAVPADAVTASGSGLDPAISPEYAELQVNRIALARGVDPAEVRAVVVANTTGRILGFLGEPADNVLAVNLALDAAHPGG